MYISYRIKESSVYGQNFCGQLCLLIGINKKSKIRHCLVGSVEFDEKTHKINYFAEHDPLFGEKAGNPDVEIDVVGFIVKRLDNKGVKDEN